MTTYSKDKVLRLLLAASVIPLLSACFHNEDDDAPADDGMMQSMVTYEISMTNATNGQPLTPVAAVAHGIDYRPWMLGNAASTGLEMLAEGGDVTQFLADANLNANVEATVSSTNGPFGPGATESVSLEVAEDSGMQLSVVAMLANTNDAFTGVANVHVGSLLLGQSKSMMAHVYDAGTEGNSESMATMPGPAAGGEGFNSTRDDTDFVSIHAGVVTVDDGLTTSALNEGHRWIGPAAKITIMRIR